MLNFVDYVLILQVVDRILVLLTLTTVREIFTLYRYLKEITKKMLFFELN